MSLLLPSMGFGKIVYIWINVCIFNHWPLKIIAISRKVLRHFLTNFPTQCFLDAYWTNTLSESRFEVNHHYYHHHHYHYHSVLTKSRSFTGNSGSKAAVLLKGRSSTAKSGTKVAVLLMMNRCGSFPLLSAPHFLFSIWSDLKRSQGQEHGDEESGFG